MIDGTRRRYVDEPLHLAGMRENEPLHIPTVDEYFAATGRVLIGEDFHHYTQDSPFTLTDGPPPQVLGGFTWSGLYIDNALNIDISSFFTTAQISGELPYRAWRVRGMWRSGWFLAYYGTSPPSRTPTDEITSMAQSHDGFNPVTGGWALALGNGNLINEFPYGSGNFYFMGGPPGMPVDLWFPIHFQIEVGYGSPNDGTAGRQAGSWDWPAFTAGIGTDLLQYRGYSPQWACFNGFANAPNVIALGGCPFTGQGGYVPPSEPPEDL